MEKKILVFSNGEKIGDGIIKLPLLYEIKKRLPEYKLVWITNKGSTAYRDKLKFIAAQYIDEIIEKADLSPFFWMKISKNYDLVVTTSGLTKYELLAAGSNFSVICENKKFYNYHKPFSKKKLNYELGYYKNYKILNEKVRKLVEEFEIFFKNKKTKKVDFYGADRIINKIEKTFF